MANTDNTFYLRGACTLSSGRRYRWSFGIAVFYRSKESAYPAKTTAISSNHRLPVTGKKDFFSQPMILFYTCQKFLVI